jgi:hypothetical protein
MKLAYWKTIFIHIPRTSGTSLKWALNNKIHDLEYINAQSHQFAIERRKMMEYEQWNVCYKFTIVRNPWERAVSWYSLRRPSVSFKEWLLKIDIGQSHYFTDGDVVLVDDIFQYETLNDHLEELCRKACWPTIQRLTEINTATHRPYQTYYDFETQSYVARQCAFEIEHCQYRF